MELNVGQVLQGFVVDYSQPLPELKATLHRMHHAATRADLIWLDREDDNKTFAIAFKTLPQDSTGVFHILEHSVLCGSEKYPVKEPFVDMLKSSMQTFMNAFTFPDKTMYPFSSRNDRDFLNLMDVYLDAVFHPLSVTDPHAFLQEGWHYELEDGVLKRNGVVYNEMKGAYASPDSILMYEMERALYPDNCYGFESGGHPDHITELTYEEYLASHRRYYHPSNARIVLDGSVDLEQVLAKLEEYLGAYDYLRVDADIPMQAPVTTEEVTACYEVDGGIEGKTILAQGWVTGDFSQFERNTALSVLTTLLCSGNESPLKKALLEKGLCEDVEFSREDGIQQNYLMLVCRNTDPEKKELLWQTVEDTLRGLAEQGLDRKRLHALLNRLEFTTREKDFGSMSRGVVYAMTALEPWLYGGDPAQNLCCDAVFASLRQQIDLGGFEALLNEVFLANPHYARVTLLPSTTLGEEKRLAEEQRCREILASWDEATIVRVTEEFTLLRQRQEREDSPEQKATLPRLKLSDLRRQVRPMALEVRELEGRPLLSHPQETDGIIYLELYFSLEDKSPEELTELSFLCSVLGQLATGEYTVPELRSAIEGNLGRLSVGHTVHARFGQRESCQPRLVVSLSLLEHRKEEGLHLMNQVLHHTKFDDETTLRSLLRQQRLAMEQRMVESGNAYAAQRAGRGLSAKGYAEDQLQGLAKLRWLQRMDKDTSCSLGDRLAALAEGLFDRSRLVVSAAGTRDEQWLSRIVELFSDGAPMGAPVTYALPEDTALGLQIPAEVGFAARVSNLLAMGEDYTGVGRVAAQMLTFGYLWNTVRVKGGAYGTGMSVTADGSLRLTSYRDPRCGDTLACFDRTGEALREACRGGEDLENCIISTIGEMEPLLSPRSAAVLDNSLYFNGRTDEDRQRIRSQVLDTTREELMAFSRVLDKAVDHSVRCVFGGKASLDGCGEVLERRENLQ